VLISFRTYDGILTTQDEVSLCTREKHVLAHVAKPNWFGRDQLAELKAIQCGLKLLL
jgi:hypothetical protein